jgi:hypothetical protein
LRIVTAMQRQDVTVDIREKAFVSEVVESFGFLVDEGHFSALPSEGATPATRWPRSTSSGLRR